MPTDYRTWVWLLLVCSVQVYILYSSIHRYVTLKNEVVNGFLVTGKDYKWIVSLLNCQLYVIIIVLGLLPLWVYSTLFSSASFFCGSSFPLNMKGFYQLVWDEALTIMLRNAQMDFVGINRDASKCCRGNVKVAVFMPISSLLHVLMAYLFIVPLPYTEAWLVQTNDERQENIWSGIYKLDFFGSNNLILKINHSAEYLNFFISLLSLSVQFSKLLWLCNKLFSIFLNSIQIMTAIHVLVNFSLFSIFLKYYYKHLTQFNDQVIEPCFMLLITSIGDGLLIFASFSYFQFAYEKCVQSLLMSTWFRNLNRPDHIPSSNSYEHSNCHSMTSGTAFYLQRNVADKSNSLCPNISAAILFLLGMGMKAFGCYQYISYIRNSHYLMAYVVHSAILVIGFFLIWFGMCLKPDWTFKMTEQQLNRYSIITYPEKAESNYYRSLRSQQGNSQMSLSVASNTIGSIHSKSKEVTDGTNYNQYLTHCMSLNLPTSYRSTIGSYDYFPLNNHVNQSSQYRSNYCSNSVSGPSSPTFNNFPYRDLKKPPPPNAKCLTPTLSILRSDKSDEFTRKFKTSYTIEEEMHPEIDCPTSEEEEDVFLDNAHSLLKFTDQLKNNPNLKFVTFQLDKTPPIVENLSSSIESLTAVSLDTSEKFIKELENGTDNGIHFASYNTSGTVKENVNSLYKLENTCSDV